MPARPAGAARRRPIEMAPKPCVSQHFRDFGQNDGNEEIPCPKRGAEQAFWHAARRKNLVSKTFVALLFWSRKSWSSSKSAPWHPRLGPEYTLSSPLARPSRSKKRKNMFRKKKYFSKAKDSLGRDLEEYGDNKNSPFTIGQHSFRYVPEDLES